MNISIEKIKKDAARAKVRDSRWYKEALEDIKFALGEQWKQDVKQEIENQGRPVLTLNIIQPLIFLASGYQRSNRSTIKGFPIGGEDQISSDIVTKLIADVKKTSYLSQKISQLFEEGIICGKSFLEPYIDDGRDIFYGELKFKVANPGTIKIDPNSVEYDLSDAKYVVKELPVTKDELKELFPDKESEIDRLDPYVPEDVSAPETEEEKIGVTNDYPSVSGMEDYKRPQTAEEDSVFKEDSYLLTEYYYKKYIKKFLAADEETGQVRLFDKKKEAEEWLSSLGTSKRQKIIPRFIPEIWLCSCVNYKVILRNDLSPFYPQWKNYPIIPFFAHYTALAKKMLKRDDLAYQGIVRSLKDPQREKNKRRSQILHIVNSMANAAWLEEEDVWVKEEEVKKFGSTPAVHLKYKKGRTPPQRLFPMPPPQAHLLLEKEAENDIRFISGINADLLAIQDKTTSGRAIALRQQQGIMILKRVFDNLSWTIYILGRFILSQLSQIYSVEKAMRLLGSEFIIRNFSHDDSEPAEVVYARAQKRISEILSDDELGRFDVSVGEGMDSPTVRYSNFLLLSELAEKGYPIPPDILLEYSDLPMEAKKRIEDLYKQAQSQQGQSAEQKGGQ